MTNLKGNSTVPHRSTIRIPTTSGDDLQAWLYLPEGDGPHPAVVMAHGIGGIKAGGLAPFAERFREEGFVALQTADDKFGTLHDWINEHLASDLSLSVLADQAGMSERSFSRHYAEATGQTPARAIERLRLEAARRLLSESRLTVKRIAQRCGFG
jgi:AraC-like DNA-binding protein